MALIRDAKPKKVSGGYVRIFGNEQVGSLMSRVQSAVISAGKELEKLIIEQTQQIDDIDKFVKQNLMASGVFVANKKQVKKCKILSFSGAEPDFIIFKRTGKKQNCYVVELKDGDTFDTKKASAERLALLSFVNANAASMPFTMSIHFCCFNQNNREEIVTGFKRKINIEEAMTGREFCELLELDYDEIVKEREARVDDNLPYFLSELIKIDVVRNWLKKHFA